MKPLADEEKKLLDKDISRVREFLSDSIGTDDLDTLNWQQLATESFERILRLLKRAIPS